jgi:hypothetical protein
MYGKMMPFGGVRKVVIWGVGVNKYNEAIPVFLANVQNAL